MRIFIFNQIKIIFFLIMLCILMIISCDQSTGSSKIKHVDSLNNVNNKQDNSDTNTEQNSNTNPNNSSNSNTNVNNNTQNINNSTSSNSELPPLCDPEEALKSECSDFENLTDNDLKVQLYLHLSNHTSFDYWTARTMLFTEIDLVNNSVQCVYTGKWVSTGGREPDGDKMNCEHTWPQSWGSDEEPAKSDLHHLFPSTPTANENRSYHQFGWVEDSFWTEGGSSLGKNSNGKTVFEVRDEHKGDTARAMLYFSVRYQMQIYNDHERILMEWHFMDPPDDYEINRNSKIESKQNNRNIFIDCPNLVCRISDF